MKKIIFICKTDLNVDGRILNQLKILENTFQNYFIDFILLPEMLVSINLGRNVKIHNIKTLIRNNNFFRFFTVLNFAFKALSKIIKIKPDIIHVQDDTVTLPILIYRILKGKKFILIYDDHEMPNEFAGIFTKLLYWFENLLMKKSDLVLFANKERMDVIKEKNKLKNKYSYFLNLPYFEENNQNKVISKGYKNILNELDIQINNGIKFIMHQGPLAKDRGRLKLVEFSKNFLLILKYY